MTLHVIFILVSTQNLTEMLLPVPVSTEIILVRVILLVTDKIIVGATIAYCNSSLTD